MNKILDLLSRDKVSGLPHGLDDEWGEGDGISTMEFCGVDSMNYRLEYQEEWSSNYWGEYDLDQWGFHIYKWNGEWVQIHEWLNPLECIYYLGVYGGKNPFISKMISYDGVEEQEENR